VRVELLYWAGCPSHPQALRELREALTESGLDPDSVLVREIETEDAARQEQFVGSPTIRVNDRDIQPPHDEPAGLTCRVYVRRDGRVSPTPDPEDLREALRTASAAEAAAASAGTVTSALAGGSSH